MFFSVCLSFAATMQEAKVKAMKPSLLKKMKEYIVELPKKRALAQPYVTIDHLYGWVSVVGAGRKDTSPPTIPKGSQAKQYKNCRPPLSEATELAFVPTQRAEGKEENEENKPMKTPSGRARLKIQEAIKNVMRHIITGHGGRPCFSTSLLDFVIRAAFTLERERGDEKQQAGEKQIEEVGWLVWRDATKARDPLKLLKQDDGGQVEDQGGVPTSDAPAIAKGMLMEENLATSGLAVIFTHKQVKRLQAADKEQSGEMPAEVSWLDLATGQGEGGHTDQSREKALREDRLRKRVDMMFSPAPYRRGLPLERLQVILLELQHVSRDELMHWLDIFEEQWAIEKRKGADELRHVACLYGEQSTQADDLQEPAPDSNEDELRKSAQHSETEQETDATKYIEANESLLTKETKNRMKADQWAQLVGLRWLRLAKDAGAGVSVFKLSMLLPATRRQQKHYEKKMSAKLQQITSDALQVEEHTQRLQRKEIDGLGLASDPGVQALLGRTLEVKKFQDAEATVVSHELGTGRNARRMGALVCVDDQGKNFKISTGFSDAERDTPPAKGTIVIYQHQKKTDAGAPLLPVFVRVRPSE